MKKTSILLTSFALALAMALPSQIAKAGRPAPQNNNNNNNNNNNQNATPRPNRTPKAAHTVIKTVDASSITVSDGKKTSTYTITNLTEVDYKGQLSTVSALKPGMLVVITVGLDPTTADRISADDAPQGNKKN